MRKLFLSLAAVSLLIGGLVTTQHAEPVYAQQTNSCTFTSSSSTPCEVSGLDAVVGQWCHIVFNGPATGAIQAAKSSDGSTWTAIPSVSRGGTVYPLPFTPNNGQVYDIAPQFVSYLRVAPASYFAGNVSGTLFCDYPAVTPTPSPTPGVFQIVAGPNITISPSGGKGIVAVQAAAGGGNTVVAGNCITVLPTASPTGGVVVAFTPAPGCTASPVATYTPYDTVILADSPTSFWRMSDTGAGANNCPNTFADSGSGNTPLTTPSPWPTGLICGSGSIDASGEGSVYFPGYGDTSDYVLIPGAAIPTTQPTASSNWTMEFQARMGGTNASLSPYLLTFDSNTTPAQAFRCGQQTGSSSAYFLGFASVTNYIFQSGPVCLSGRKVLIDLVYKANNTGIQLYVDGQGPAGSTDAPQNANGSPGAIDHDFTNAAVVGALNFGKFSIWKTTALTSAKIWAHYTAFVCGSLTVGTCSP